MPDTDFTPALDAARIVRAKARSQQCEIDHLRSCLKWAMDEIDVLSNKLCGFAYPQGMGMNPVFRPEQIEMYAAAVRARGE